MKKLAMLFLLISLLGGCGHSEKEKAITKAVYDKYNGDAIRTATYVPFNILDLEIEDETRSGDTIFYDVEFVIQEMHPSRRYYYEGDGEVSFVNGNYHVEKYHYREHPKLNR